MRKGFKTGIPRRYTGLAPQTRQLGQLGVVLGHIPGGIRSLHSRLEHRVEERVAAMELESAGRLSEAIGEP